jgi:hypothetical protein
MRRNEESGRKTEIRKNATEEERKKRKEGRKEERNVATLVNEDLRLWFSVSRPVPHRYGTTKPKLHAPVRFEVFTAVTMKNVAFWDIKTQFVLHRRHILRYRALPVNAM